MAAILKFFNVSREANFDQKFGKICENYLRKSIFDTDQVGDGVTVWPPSLNLLYSFWNESVTVQNLRDTGRIFWLIITNLGPYMKYSTTHGYIIVLRSKVK